MRLRTVLWAAIWLAGCAGHGTIDRGRLSDLAVGLTTSAGLTRAWGPPLTDATMPDGRHVLSYRYIDNGWDSSFTWGFGPVGSPTDTVTGQVTLTFDQQGVLLSYDMFGRGAE
jgi:hypothetical protein